MTSDWYRGFSGTTRRNRGGLDQALAAVWPDSVFTVTKFDRFARNMAEANQILTDLSGRGRAVAAVACHSRVIAFAQLRRHVIT